MSLVLRTGNDHIICYQFQDKRLKAYVKMYSENWDLIATQFTDRSDVQCQQRWTKVVNPELVKGPWTKEVRTLKLQPHRRQLFCNRHFFAIYQTANQSTFTEMSHNNSNSLRSLNLEYLHNAFKELVKIGMWVFLPGCTSKRHYLVVSS